MTHREPPEYLTNVPPEDDRQVAQLRIPPSSIEAEASVLGGLLLDNRAWDLVGDMLAEDDFYRSENRIVFGVIAAMANAGRPADVITVYEQLQRQAGGDSAGVDLPYLNSLAQATPSAANIRRYAEIVRERAVLRRLITACDEIATAAFNPAGKTVDLIVDEAQQRLTGIGQETSDDEWESIEDGMVQLLEHIQAVADGTQQEDVIPLGIPELDERLDGGGRPGEVIVIGARPSMGKSAVGLTFGLSTAESGEPTSFWTGEMPRQQLWKRAMSMKSGIHLSRIKRPERLRDFDWPNLTKGVESLRIPFTGKDTPGVTITKLRGLARRQKRKGGLRVLIVDHLGLMEPTDPRAPRHQQVGEITRGLKRLAKELGIVVILLVQLNRDLEKRNDPRPIMSDLRESGDIEQDADIVMFVHRPIYYKPDLGEEWKYYAEIIVAKLRDGAPGTVPCQFIGENVRFMPWPEDTPVPTSTVRVKREAKEL